VRVGRQAPKATQMNKGFLGFETNKCWEYENGFYLTSDITRPSKALAQYELYKMVVGLPGHVVECGVYKGASLVRLATFRQILESPYSRKIVGFDAFGRFPENGEDAVNQAFIRDFSAAGGDGIGRDALLQVLSYKGIIELVEGDICETVPKYAHGHPELKISLLHVDVDVYRPTKVILESLFERVVAGGLVVFDDYGTVAGETRALDEFLHACQMKLLVEKLPISHIPAYIRK
jgi:hypothetical protein